MRLILVSRDRELCGTCSGIARSMCDVQLDIEIPGSRHGLADLTIWDLSSTNGASEIDLTEARPGDLFVTSQQGWKDVQELLPPGARGLLLKPISRSVLRAFLGAAETKWPSSQTIPGE